MPATKIFLVGGSGGVALAGSQLNALPTVLVTDDLGLPIAAVSVTFAVTAGGGSGTGLVQVTNALGIAVVGSWTLGSGLNTMTATSVGLIGSPVTFNVTGVSAVVQDFLCSRRKQRRR